MGRIGTSRRAVQAASDGARLMTRGRRPGPRVLSAVVLFVALFTRQTLGSGFATARFGGEHGHVTTNNPTALYYNPAGLGFSDGVHLMADASLALRSVVWDHPVAASDPPDPMGAEGANAGRAELFNVFGAPMLGASARLGGLTLGAGLFVPFGGRAEWSKNERFVGSAAFPLAADGVQRWHSISGELAFIYGSLGVAYRLGPLSAGISANLISASVESSRARNPAGDTLGHTDQEGRADTDVSGTFGSIGAGLAFEAMKDRLWLGASYQSQPGLGEMTLAGSLTITYGGVAQKYDVQLHQALPDIVRVGARYRPAPDLELRLFGDLTRWSVMRTQCLALADYPCAVTKSGDDPGSGGIFLNFRRHWRDTVGLRAGVSRWFAPTLELYLGTGFETAATPDETLDPELPDSETIQGAFGARWEVLHTLFIGASYTHLYYLPRDNSGKSRLSEADVPTRRPDGGGRYSQWVGLINASVEKMF
jgi:long-chain fatty acid transport protein